MGGELTHHLSTARARRSPQGAPTTAAVSAASGFTTDDDPLDLAIPRDHEGIFAPVLIAKSEQHFTGFDDRIIAMYARGMNMRET
ncbi:transposase [Paraburkholderia caballeronis]|uniref:transposase n=1 Tax=Paraburkholderia caballeronis TaxID=416943 RepID=UPI000B830C95|nr:transposase [Paraburkholderia caballeronis]